MDAFFLGRGQCVLFGLDQGPWKVKVLLGSQPGTIRIPMRTLIGAEGLKLTQAAPRHRRKELAWIPQWMEPMLPRIAPSGP